MSWFFKKDLRLKEGGWLTYADEQSEKIEAAYQDKKKKIKLTDTWSINLVEMYQYRNSDRSRQRPIKREDDSKKNNHNKDCGIDDRLKKKAQCLELDLTAIEKKITKRHREEIEMISKKHAEEMSHCKTEMNAQYRKKEDECVEKEKQLCIIRKQLKKKMEELNNLNKEHQSLTKKISEIEKTKLNLAKHNKVLKDRQSLISVSLSRVQKQLERSQSTVLSQELIKHIQTQSQTLCNPEDASLTQVYSDSGDDGASNASPTQVYDDSFASKEATLKISQDGCEEATLKLDHKENEESNEDTDEELEERERKRRRTISIDETKKGY